MADAPVGLILAGGLGRRMTAGRRPAGQPTMGDAAPASDSPPELAPELLDVAAPGTALKPLVRLHERPLIGHVIARVRPQVSRLAINANDAPEAFAAFGLPIIADTLPDRPGPLAGVLAGLEWLAQEAPGAPLLTVSADTPFLPLDLVSRLAARHRETGRVVCAASDGQIHHVIALWPAAARMPLRTALEAGQRKVGVLLQALQAVTESWDTDDGDPFFNVNTPEDLAVARFRSPALQ